MFGLKVSEEQIIDFSYYGLTIDNSNNVYLTGRAFGTVDFDPGPGVSNITPVSTGGYAFIVKLDSAGNYVWAKDFGQTTSTAASATVYSIAVDAMQNVYTIGSFKDSIDFNPGTGQAILVAKSNNEDIFISKLDSSGNYVWAKSMGSNRSDQGLSIVLDKKGGLYATGVFNDTVDFDPGPAVYNLMANSAQNSDIFILKLNTSGDFVWAKDIGEPQAVYMKTIFLFQLS